MPRESWSRRHGPCHIGQPGSDACEALYTGLAGHTRHALARDCAASPVRIQLPQSSSPAHDAYVYLSRQLARRPRGAAPSPNPKSFPKVHVWLGCYGHASVLGHFSQSSVILIRNVTPTPITRPPLLVLQASRTRTSRPLLVLTTIVTQSEYKLVSDGCEWES